MKLRRKAKRHPMIHSACNLVPDRRRRGRRERRCPRRRRRLRTRLPTWLSLGRSRRSRAPRRDLTISSLGWRHLGLLSVSIHRIPRTQTDGNKETLMLEQSQAVKRTKVEERSTRTMQSW